MMADDDIGRLKARMTNVKRKMSSLIDEIAMVEAIIRRMTKPKDEYDWEKDKSLSVNHPGYDPKKE